MNQIFRNSLCLTVLLVSCAASAVDNAVAPLVWYRSQGFNANRELVGWQTQINRFDMCNFYGSFSVTPEYTRSFWPNSIASCLFGPALVDNCCLVSTTTPCTPTCHPCPTNCNTKCCDTSCCDNGKGWCNNDCCSFIKVQGSKVPNRSANALLADNFYLPTDFSSEISLCPRVENFLVDLNLYLGLDEWCEGMFFRVHMPVCWTRWGLNFCETVKTEGTNPYDAGYVDNLSANTGLTRAQMLNNFTEFVSCGDSITDVTGITYNPLLRARWSKCALKKTSVAELTAAWGWNFWMCEDYHVGLELRAAAPTGNRPCGDYIFEPVVGNGHHWELGLGLTSHWRLWCSECEDKDFSVYLDANVQHLFKTRQCRTFDLCGKPLSRYMLAAKFTDKVANLYAQDGAASAAAPAPKYQFANEFMPVANLLTIPVDSSAAVQGELALKFAYRLCGWQFDLGYDFWGRSCEKICKRCDCCTNGGLAANTWGLKGDAFVYGYQATGTPLTPVANTLGTALSATESNATVFGGTNGYPAGLNTLKWNQNPGIDNPKAAWAASTNGNALVTSIANSGVWDQVDTSLQPVLIDECMIDTHAAETQGISNKVFGHIGYTWQECECWVPYLGIGGEAEFGQRCGKKSCNKSCDTSCCNPCNNSCVSNCNVACNSNCNTSCGSVSSSCSPCNTSCCDTSCNDCCQKCALSQWGVWIKGGVSFN